MKYVKEKIQRGYQGKGKLLIIVPLYSSKPIKIPMNAPYRENIRIMPPSEFSDFFGYNNLIREELFSYIQLAKKASYIEESLSTLQFKTDESKQMILQNFNFKQEQFEATLKSLGLIGILRRITDKRNIDHFI